MRYLIPLLAVLFLISPVRSEELTSFELRTYFAAEGKLENLHARFRDHTLALFEKHGIANLIYWAPAENPENALIYLLGYPNKAAREASWKAFLADPEWIAAKKASEEEGKLVAKAENIFLHLTDYSPSLPLKPDTGPRLFEMRRYTTLPGKLEALDARFRDHTLALFDKHGMTNLQYFHLDEGQEGSDVTLLYFLAHDSEESMKASFNAFREDPVWHAARDASEKDGKLLIEKGVVSTLLLMTDYSPIK